VCVCVCACVHLQLGVGEVWGLGGWLSGAQVFAGASVLCWFSCKPAVVFERLCLWRDRRDGRVGRHTLASQCVEAPLLQVFSDLHLQQMVRRKAGLCYVVTPSAVGSAPVIIFTPILMKVFQING